MIILYGVYENYIDVTKITLERCNRYNHFIIIPAGDYNRSSLYGDPIYGVVKNIIIIDENT